MIEFRTAEGTRVWTQPQFIASITDGGVKTDESEKRAIGTVQLMSSTIFFVTREEALWVVEQLARASGDDWKLGIREEVDA